MSLSICLDFKQYRNCDIPLYTINSLNDKMSLVTLEYNNKYFVELFAEYS